MDRRSEIILNKSLLEGTAYFFCSEMGITRLKMVQPSVEIMNDLISKGIIASDHKLLNQEFGYTCYEYYRQLYAPDYFDKLLIKEARTSRKILDLCCGGGATIFSLLENKPELIYGLDWNETQIELLEAMLRDSQAVESTVVAKVGDAHALSLASQSVDFVVCRVALQYLNVEQVLKEINHMLSPQGKVFLLVHGSGYMLDYLFTRKGVFRRANISFLLKKFLRSRRSDNKHRVHRTQANFLTMKGLKRKLADAGFREIEIHTHKELKSLGMFPVYFAVTAER